MGFFKNVIPFPKKPRENEHTIDKDPGDDEPIRIVIESYLGTEKVERNKGRSMLKLIEDYTVLDLETTGFYNMCSIIDIGALKIRNNEVVDEFQTLINCDYIPPEITELTGITEADVEDAPPIEEAIQEVLEFIGNDTVVAHNANFDINFLYDNVLQVTGNEFQNDFVDTLRIARRAYPELDNHKLDTLAAHLKLPGRTFHRGLGDCHITHALYRDASQKIRDEKIPMYKKKKHPKKSDFVPSDAAVIEENHPMFGKQFVFTGTLLHLVRKEAMQAVVDHGGKVSNTINKKSHYLVMGIQDYELFANGKESSKTIKAKQLIGTGQNLKIIDENEFMNMLREKK